MIQKDEEGVGGYTLYCDHCEELVDEPLGSFMEDVEYKKQNGWRSIKGKSGAWHEVCPACGGNPDVCGKFREE